MDDTDGIIDNDGLWVTNSIGVFAKVEIEGHDIDWEADAAFVYDVDEIVGGADKDSKGTTNGAETRMDAFGVCW